MGKTLTMDFGFQPQDALLTQFELSQAGYSTETAGRFQRQLPEKVSQLPGVKAAGYSHTTPLESPSTTDVFAQQTADFKRSNKAFSSYIFSVSPGYFAAAGTPLLAGREIVSSDTAKTPLVAVVNQTFARHLFHSDLAVGRFFKRHVGMPIQIVGVVADGKYLSLSEDPQEAMFCPISQEVSTATSLLVRTQGDPAYVAATIRKALRDLDPTIPVRTSSSWKTQLAMSFFPARVATAALSLFGVFGLLLSIAGTFGLASYTVSKRMRELSIRVALGAEARQILSIALGRMLILLAAGSVVGMLLGVATTGMVSAVVYQGRVVLLSVLVTMVLTGLLSVAGPVRRALHIDPATLLREQ